MNILKWLIIIVAIFAIGYVGASIAYSAIMSDYVEPKQTGYINDLGKGMPGWDLVVKDFDLPAPNSVSVSVMKRHATGPSKPTLEVKPSYGEQTDQFYRVQPAHNINQLTTENL